MITNCPNCGAPIEGAKCKYCGTLFDMPETVQIELHAEGEPLELAGRLSEFITRDEARKMILRRRKKGAGE